MTWIAPVVQACPTAPICAQGWARAGRGLPSNIKSTVSHGRAATFQSTVDRPWHLGAVLLGYRGTWYLPHDLLYRYLL